MLAYGRHPVRIAVEGELYAGVPSEVLDVLGVHASTEKQREAGVTEIVPPYVGQPCSPEQWFEVTVYDVLGVKRRAFASRKYEPRILVTRDPCLSHRELRNVGLGRRASVRAVGQR
jgi:hypothetical protein